MARSIRNFGKGGGDFFEVAGVERDAIADFMKLAANAVVFVFQADGELPPHPGPLSRGGRERIELPHRPGALARWGRGRAASPYALPNIG